MVLALHRLGDLVTELDYVIEPRMGLGRDVQVAEVAADTGAYAEFRRDRARRPCSSFASGRSRCLTSAR